ncbi:hypothetical protein WA158_004943 [Blastocystis sp. Blastoise]
MMKLFVLCFVFLLASSLSDQCDIPDIDRLDCLPVIHGDIQEDCASHGCCYMPAQSNMGQPWCYLPKNFGYSTSELKREERKDTATLLKHEETNIPYPNPVNKLHLETIYETDKRLHIKITDSEKARFEIPIELSKSEEKPENIDYSVDYKEETFSINVSRVSTGATIFDTSIGGFMYSDQFIQLATRLPTNKIYGLGEHTGIPLLLDINWKTITIFPHDATCPNGYHNLYGHQPFYMGLDKDNNAYGVLFYNSNAMDIILQPTPALTFRTIGGIIDIYIFMGPTPEEVVEQYTSLVGKPFLPPVWGLGFQLCRWGYNSLEAVKTVHDRMRKYEIPYDIQWNDIDAFDQCHIFTYNKKEFAGLPEFIQQLHDENMKYVIMIDPAFPEDYYVADSAKKYNILMRDPDGKGFYKVTQWAGTEVISDYTHPNATFWLKEMLETYRKDIPIDAAWIDMNELGVNTVTPCAENNLNNPPYLPNVYGGKLTANTACMDTLHYNDQLHYNMHSLYAYYEAETTLKRMQEATGKRSFDISRSSFVGQGKFGGHWGGDNDSNWGHLKDSIWTTTMFNMYGIPFVGVDICGFSGTTNAELCTRWTQLGAFYPFSRNHNAIGSPDQDPAAFGDEVAVHMRDALNVRYTLLPYLYTLMFKSHITGNTVARPLFFNYPQDSETHAIDEQMMWSDAVLINPVLKPNVTSIHSYFPAGKWYSWWNKETIIETEGEWKDEPVTIDNIPIYVKGGHILITQPPKPTVFDTRKGNVTIEVFLDKNMEATGEFYIDDGDCIDPYENNQYSHFTMEHKKQKFSITTVAENYKDIPSVNTVLFYGFNNKPSFVFVNQKQFTPVYKDGVLIFDALQGDIFKGVTIQWRY